MKGCQSDDIWSAGVRLHGRDAERMADLCEKVAEEQQQFIRAQWLDAQDAERFRYMDPRVEAQLQVRRSVRSVPVCAFAAASASASAASIASF